jgi:hypothetical protein
MNSEIRDDPVPVCSVCLSLLYIRPSRLSVLLADLRSQYFDRPLYTKHIRKLTNIFKTYKLVDPLLYHIHISHHGYIDTRKD